MALTSLTQQLTERRTPNPVQRPQHLTRRPTSCAPTPLLPLPQSHSWHSRLGAHTATRGVAGAVTAAHTATAAQRRRYAACGGGSAPITRSFWLLSRRAGSHAQSASSDGAAPPCRLPLQRNTLLPGITCMPHFWLRKLFGCTHDKRNAVRFNLIWRNPRPAQVRPFADAESTHTPCSVGPARMHNPCCGAQADVQPLHTSPGTSWPSLTQPRLVNQPAFVCPPFVTLLQVCVRVLGVWVPLPALPGCSGRPWHAPGARRQRRREGVPPPQPVAPRVCLTHSRLWHCVTRARRLSSWHRLPRAMAAPATSSHPSPCSPRPLEWVGWRGGAARSSHVHIAGLGCKLLSHSNHGGIFRARPRSSALPGSLFSTSKVSNSRTPRAEVKDPRSLDISSKRPAHDRPSATQRPVIASLTRELPARSHRKRQDERQRPRAVQPGSPRATLHGTGAQEPQLVVSWTL